MIFMISLIIAIGILCHYSYTLRMVASSLNEEPTEDEIFEEYAESYEDYIALVSNILTCRKVR